jgi:hypothetical protein
MWWARLLNNVIGVLAPTTPLVTSSYESIATTVVGSGGQASIDFTVIPSTYKHLQIRVMSRVVGSVDNENLTLQFNGDTGGNYNSHYLYGTGSGTPAAGADVGSNTTAVVGRSSGANLSSGIFGTSIIDILDYSNTNKYTTNRTLCGVDANGSGILLFDSSLWRNTAAVTSIKLLGSSNFAQYSSFALYGIKG